MNTRIKTDQPASGDVECGSIDSGLAEDVIVRKTVSVARKACANNNAGDDPQSDINCYGVGVIKMDN